MFPVIEPNGMVTGMASRSYCHSGSKLLHPVVHLHVLDRYSGLWLQKRSMDKDIQPGKWDTAVGGHVDYGECLLEALFRESREELGLKDFNPVFICSYVFESEIERELVNVFAAVGSYEMKFDKTEIDEIRCWDIPEVDSAMGKGIFTPNFENEYREIKRPLLALL
ncbi:MAG: NUDIX domain-containing protein [Candidatus Cryptobacteroides sp.]